MTNNTGFRSVFNAFSNIARPKFVALIFIEYQEIYKKVDILCTFQSLLEWIYALAYILLSNSRRRLSNSINIKPRG